MSLNPDFQASLFQDIAPARAMQLSIMEYADGRLEISAPLEPSINDKGTAFAGSISSLLVLAGWGLVTLRLREAGIRAEVVVSRNETVYKRPIRSEMHAHAEAGTAKFDQLITDLTGNGRGNIRIHANLLSQEKLCATMTATYVAAVVP